MSRDFAIFMSKHLAGYYLWTVTFLAAELWGIRSWETKKAPCNHFKSHKVPHSFYYLPIYIHLRTRFELYLKPLIVNRNLLNQPSHQHFIILRDLSRLLFQKLPHLFDSLFQSLPLGTLHQSVLFQFPQPINRKISASAFYRGNPVQQDISLWIYPWGPWTE